MAIGKVRAGLIIALFVGATAVPVLMESAIVPMINILNFVENFISIKETNQNGTIVQELEVKFDAILNSVKDIRVLTDESGPDQTVLQLTMNISNDDPYEFQMLFPGLELTIYWKAGMPYSLEKETVLGWKNESLGTVNSHQEPNYPTRRWTRVIGVSIDSVRIKPHEEKDLVIKLYLYNDKFDKGESNALGQMIGSILRTQSTLDPYTDETLMHLSGSAYLAEGVGIPIDFDLGFDLSSFLDLSSMLGGGSDGGLGGAASEAASANLFDLLFDVPLAIFDIQNYNDSNPGPYGGRFTRDYSGIDNQTGQKIWTEDLYQNGALSAYVYMDLVLGMNNLNLTLLQSSYNADDSDINKTWYPEIGGQAIDESTTTNQIFLYLPNYSSLLNPDWSNKIFGVFGFTSDQHIDDPPGSGHEIIDLGDGRVIAGGTLRLTGDLRENSNFDVGNSFGALLTQAIDGILPIGIFGSIDLMLNEMPLSICLDLPLELNLSTFLGDMMGGGEEEGEGGDIFSMLLDYVGLKSILFNGLAFDTYNQLLQLNLTTDLDMFLPYGIYMPDEVTYDQDGVAVPYLGIGGGPIQLFDDEVPANWDSMTEPAKKQWRDKHLIMNITSLDSENLMESMAKLMATIGGSGYAPTGLGDGIAYIFDDNNAANGPYGNLGPVRTPVGNFQGYLRANEFEQLPNSELKSEFNFTMDDFLLDLKDIAPDFGNGLLTLAEQIGLDPLFLQYLNNSIPGDNPLTGLLSIRQLLNIISQDGPKNDIFDYLLDANITNSFKVGLDLNPYWNGTQWVYADNHVEKNFIASYLEKAEVIDANTLRVTNDGVKDIMMIINGTYDEGSNTWTSPHSWWGNLSAVFGEQIYGDVTHPVHSFTSNGLITVDTSTTSDSFLQSGDIYVMYTTNKLALLDISNLIGAVLNLTLGTGDGGDGAGEPSSDIFSDIFEYLPGTLNAIGIDFDRIMPSLIEYLRINISQPEPIGYGIKPFELLDVGYHALMSTESGEEGTGDVFEGPSRDLIDNMIKELTAKFVEQADPFQLIYAGINDLTPILDYLNRSGIFSREVLLPLIATLFPSGSEAVSGATGESFDISELFDIIMPLISEMLVGGDDAAFPHEALNPFALLSSAESIEWHSDLDYDELAGRGYSIYQVGQYNWTPDYPRYDNLRLLSNLTLGLLLSGFDAGDLWDIINQLGLIDLGGGDGGGTADPFSGLKSLLSLLGVFVPPGEWDSLLRELGVWSTWEGDFQYFDIWVTPYILGIPLTIYFNGMDFVNYMINLEQILATGMLGVGGLSEFVQLSLYENQSYGNPYTYVAGYDSSYNTGPYRDLTGQNPVGSCDNWGWVPVGWDPGGYEYGTAPEYKPDGAKDYKRSFLSKLISTVPVELDIDVQEIEPINIAMNFDFQVWIFTIPVDIAIAMSFAPELFMRIRLEGNPSALTLNFEQEGIPLFGLGAHFVGGDLAGMVTDMVDSLTQPGNASAGGEAFEFPELDVVTLLQAFLNAKVDILHYWKYITDPEFMKASDWWLDPGFVDMNASSPTLIFDEDPRIPGDNDEIPDEYPWYRFLVPEYNQVNPNVGPSYREPALIDYLIPTGPPGSGRWQYISGGNADGIPDAIQHYWFDTPYAYVNSTVSPYDPWPNIDPYLWNNVPGPGYYEYATPNGTTRWGDDPGEQVPLLQTAPGVGIPNSVWDNIIIPRLYLVPIGTSPGITSSSLPANPIPGISGTSYYPNIWNSFEYTLNQTDYRFGYWKTEYDEVLEKDVTFLDLKPFYDLLSYAFYPQLLDLLDFIAPLITDLIVGLITPNSGGGTGSVSSSMGTDYYINTNYDSVYSKFGIEQNQALDPIAMLQWLWDGAGTRWDGTKTVPYIEPYTVPDLQGMLNWLADHGFTLNFLIKNLDKIFGMLSTDSGEASQGAVDLAGDLASIFSTESILSVVNAIEDYMQQIVAQNPDGSPNRTKATQIALEMMRDMTEILDIYPVKALRGVLNYLMPRLSESGTAGGSSIGDVNQLDLGTFLEQSRLLDIIFVNTSKLNDLKFTIGIYDTSIDLYLFGQKIEDLPLNMAFNLDLASLLGGGDDGGSENGGSATDALNNMPISFPKGGLPYIELSTFNGPFDITFHLWNTSLGAGKGNIANTNVTIGEIWYNETTGVYIFNRTQSSYESEMGISGWTDAKDGIFRTYIRPNSLLRSDSSGMVQYSSIIETDDFGWVDPYIYIHVEPPNDYPSVAFYWWNVTGHPVQKTLAGNTPPYQAPWIDDGRDIAVQTSNTLPGNSINIDDDSYWEIFAQVEIDGRHMPIHDVVYVEMGSVSDLQVANATGSFPPQASVQINASYTEVNQDWKFYVGRDTTTFILQDEITPTGKSTTYPTISQVISGFHMETYNWNDDSLYKLKVDYINLTDPFTLHNIYNFDIGKTLGVDSNILTYPTAPPTGFNWVENPTSPAPVKTVTMTFSPQQPAENFGNYKYGNITIDASNFVNKTIRSVKVDVTVNYGPEIAGSDTCTEFYQDYEFRKPGEQKTFFFHQDLNLDEVIIKGDPGNLNTMSATSAWFNYTVPITGDSFLNGIDWHVKALETLNAGSTIAITNVIVQYFNETDGLWWTLYARDSGDIGSNREWEPEDDGYAGTGYLDDFADLDTVLGVGPVADLYLTNRKISAFENITYVKFAARLTESTVVPNDGLGYINGTKASNTSVWVSFIFRPFLTQWSYKIPTGFVSDFQVTVELYDPLLFLRSALNANDYPRLQVDYWQMGPLNSQAVIDAQGIFARKVLVYIEAWDSLVRSFGDHGDILLKDNYTEGTRRLVPLDNQPIMNTSIKVIDTEAKVYINVTIGPDQILRNYFLQFNISPGLGYEGRGYTDNYRFSLATVNVEAMKTIGAYPSKKIETKSSYGFPTSIRVGLADLQPMPIQYVMYYILTFEVSPEFLVNATARVTFSFTGVWEKSEGSYEVRSDKMYSATRQIDVVFN